VEKGRKVEEIIKKQYLGKEEEHHDIRWKPIVGQKTPAVVFFKIRKTCLQSCTGVDSYQYAGTTCRRLQPPLIL